MTKTIEQLLCESYSSPREENSKAPLWVLSQEELERFVDLVRKQLLEEQPAITDETRKAMAVLREFVERSTHWREGGATRHDALYGALPVLEKALAIKEQAS